MTEMPAHDRVVAMLPELRRLARRWRRLAAAAERRERSQGATDSGSSSSAVDRG